jgi:hypothetical protein
MSAFTCHGKCAHHGCLSTLVLGAAICLAVCLCSHLPLWRCLPSHLCLQLLSLLCADCCAWLAYMLPCLCICLWSAPPSWPCWCWQSSCLPSVMASSCFCYASRPCWPVQPVQPQGVSCGWVAIVGSLCCEQWLWYWWWLGAEHCLGCHTAGGFVNGH